MQIEFSLFCTVFTIVHHAIVNKKLDIASYQLGVNFQVIVTSTLLLLKLIGVSLSELLPAGHPNNWLHCLLHGTRMSYHNTLLQK